MDGFALALICLSGCVLGAVIGTMAIGWVSSGRCEDCRRAMMIRRDGRDSEE